MKDQAKKELIKKVLIALPVWSAESNCVILQRPGETPEFIFAEMEADESFSYSLDGELNGAAVSSFVNTRIALPWKVACTFSEHIAARCELFTGHPNPTHYSFEDADHHSSWWSKIDGINWHSWSTFDSHEWKKEDPMHRVLIPRPSFGEMRRLDKVSISSSEKWRPDVGQPCEAFDYLKNDYQGCVFIGNTTISAHPDWLPFTSLQTKKPFYSDLFRPAKTEREKFKDKCKSILNPDNEGIHQFNNDMNTLYDNGARFTDGG